MTVCICQDSKNCTPKKDTFYTCNYTLISLNGLRATGLKGLPMANFELKKNDDNNDIKHMEFKDIHESRGMLITEGNYTFKW